MRKPLALKSELAWQIKDEYVLSYALSVLFLDDKNYSAKFFGIKFIDSENTF